ncbi:MAG: hypothetical protein H6835_15040 [Planctomycetes bacterium]|nr:hypothetical protein [Planctomycetota bacterium]
MLRVRQKGGRVVVSLRIWNDHDEPVSFDYGNIRLVFQGREASAQPPRRPTEIQARGNEELVWIFECGSDLPGKSSYDIEIRDFLLSGVPSGQSAVFQIRT